MLADVETLELDTGQLAIAADVVERNGQGAFAGVARPAEPAPLNHEPERPAAELAEERYAIRAAIGDRVIVPDPDGLHGVRYEPAAHEEERKRLYEPGQRVTLKTSAKPSKRVYRCGCCGRKLKPDHYVYSRFTHSRYCWPGEGCQKPGRS